VEIFQWFFKNHLAGKWSMNEVIGEMLLLQFAFVYTTSYVRFVFSTFFRDK
jgi:hypothetical protein